MRRSGLMLLVVAVVAGCTSTPPPTPSVGSSAAPPSPRASATSPSSPPSPSDARSVTPTVAGTPPVSPTIAPTVGPTVSSADPPAAILSASASIDSRPGRLGTFIFGGLASDAPWLPARILQMVELAPGGTLKISFADGSSINGWSARYASAADTEGVVKKTLGGSEELDRQQILLGPPPAGDWVLDVSLGYPANLGSGEYYWHVRVVP